VPNYEKAKFNFMNLKSKKEFFIWTFLTAEDHTIRRSVGLPWSSDQPVAEASTYTGQHNI
jgi:hypothetical protein